MEILQVKNLTFKYPEAEKNALNNVSLCVNSGDFIVVCGESGCGKSTLLKMIKKELSPFGEKSGEVLYKGTSLDNTDDRTLASQIGFVLQNPESQIVTDTVWHELAFGLENLGLDTQIIRRRVAEMASYFGIEQWFYKKTADLSGGQKQLLNLASVIAMNPSVLLLDEPTAQLDPIAASNFIGTLQKINRELGLTVILAEHRLEEVFPLADKVIVMEKGNINFAGAPQNISDYFINHPNHPMLLGLPAAMRIFNLLKETGESPITIREGKNYITQNYQNNISSLNNVSHQHNEQIAVELKNVCFRYGRDLPDVLKSNSLTVYKGEHFCVLGGNSAGKTTVLAVIAGLLKAYHGKIYINRKKISEYKNGSLYIKNIALLPQNPQTVFIGKTVDEDLREICKTMKFSAEETENRICKVLKTLGIEHLLNMHPYDLSGGEQQKAALAKILLSEPEILLLDEPTKGIDAFSKQTLSGIISKLQNHGITVITVTHDVEFAANTADRVGMLFDGNFTSVDTPTNFFSENNFYTTAASRISRGYFNNAILCEQVAELCLKNGKKAVEQ